MIRVTAADIVRAISHLSRNHTYHYVTSGTRSIIEIVRVELPEGPIIIKRYDPAKGQTSVTAEEESISPQMIWRVANAFHPYQPINFDRVLGGSYNTRSVLEALIAHTPQFYFCYPGRIEDISSSTKIKKGHKHIIWCPDKPHTPGNIEKIETEVAISEVPTIGVIYDALVVPEDQAIGLDIDVQRRHAQIQIALLMIGNQLGYRNWIAQNDKGIIYKNQRIGEMDGVVATLRDEKLFSSYEEAIKAAMLIDCVWFKNHKLMPAVLEIEHTTGITTGLSRMKNLQDALPPFPTRYVIVASDDDRQKVIKEASKTQFQSLGARFFSYSAVEELYSLCQRRKIRGVTEEFLDCFMEPILTASA